MPQHPTPAAPPFSLYRSIADPPLPSRDDTLRDHEPAEQRRVKRGLGRLVLQRLGAEIVGALIGLLILILPILSGSIVLTHVGQGSFADLTGWNFRPPFWIALVLALIWSALGSIYLAVAFEMVLSALIGIVMLLPLLPICAVVIFLGPLWWILSVPSFVILRFVADAHGYGTVFAGLLWVVLMLAPAVLARRAGGSH